MSLRTRILAAVFGVMTAVLALLALSLTMEALSRARAGQLRQAELVAAWAQDWLNDHREALGTLAGESRWAELARRLGRSPLVADWVIAAPPAPGAELAVLAAQADGDGRAREAWASVLAQALAERRAVVRGPWVGAPLLAPDGRVVGIAMAVPAVAESTPDFPGAFARMAWVMALGTALLVLIMYVLLQRLVLRPLDALLAAAGRVARADFSRPVPDPGRWDEVAALVRAFNGMMERLAEHQRAMEANLTSARGRIADTERKLMVAQRLSSTGTLAAGIAHEVNNPLGGLMNAARALQARAGDDPRAREYTALILEGLDRIQATVRRLLQFAPRAAPAPQPVALADAVDRAVALCEHRFRERGAAVDRVVPRDLPSVHGDPGEIQQAILNVLINAADALPPSGGRVAIRAAADGTGHVALTVADNGRGMDAETLQRCADPFYTTKAPGAGTGLGLAVVQNILEHHGGTLGLASAPGRGTEVTLSFPTGAAAPDAPAAAPDALKPAAPAVR